MGFARGKRRLTIIIPSLWAHEISSAFPISRRHFTRDLGAVFVSCFKMPIPGRTFRTLAPARSKGTKIYLDGAYARYTGAAVCLVLSVSRGCRD